MSTVTQLIAQPVFLYNQVFDMPISLNLFKDSLLYHILKIKKISF